MMLKRASFQVVFLLVVNKIRAHYNYLCHEVEHKALLLIILIIVDYQMQLKNIQEKKIILEHVYERKKTHINCENNRNNHYGYPPVVGKIIH